MLGGLRLITGAFQAGRFLWLESDVVDEDIKKRRDQGEGRAIWSVKTWLAVSDSEDGGNELRTVGGPWRMTRRTASGEARTSATWNGILPTILKWRRKQTELDSNLGQPENISLHA